MPADFREAVDRDPRAGRFFDGLFYSKKQYFVLGIEGAKKAETSQRCIEKAVSTLREGRDR